MTSFAPKAVAGRNACNCEPQNRRQTLAAGFVLILSIATFAGLQAPLAAAAERRPNIILIMADDAGWECFSCYGGKDYQTPHVDALARKGIRFQHCYSTPLCTPSRVQLMTGQYNFRNYTHFGYLNPKEKTFGHLLQQAGYKTAIAGKWQLNGIHNALPGHNDSNRPLQAGFHESLLWQVTKGKQNRDGGGERYWQPPLEYNGRMISKEENWGKYGPDLFTDFICNFIERNRKRSFFVYYPMVLVHDPFVSTPDTIGNRPLAVANIAPKDPAARKRNFIAMVHYMDKLVGRIAAKVDSLGLSENTIILFTTDNGTHRSIRSQWRNSADGRTSTIRGGKGGMKDMGTHVPFTAYWKDHTPPGTALPDLVDFTDFYPTLAEAAGIALHWKDPIDGRSFLPQLKGQKGNPRDWLLCHYQPYWGQAPGQFARTADFKLYRDGRFYKVSDDLEETNNLTAGAGKVAGEIRNRLQALLDRCPPAPTEKGSRGTKFRPTYPAWENLFQSRISSLQKIPR